MQLTTTYTCGHSVTRRVDGRDARFKHARVSGQEGSRHACWPCRQAKLKSIIASMSEAEARDVLTKCMTVKYVEETLMAMADRNEDDTDCKDCGHGHRPGVACENRYCLCEGQ